MTQWREVLDGLDALRNERGMAVILLAHTKIEKFEDPESVAYDRYSPRLHKHAAALVTEWCDGVLFALFQINPDHMRTVFHLEKVHSTGFARMKLKGNARKPDNVTFKEFLTPEVVEGVLARFDATRHDGRSSEFKNIVQHAGQHLVFIRREERRTMLLKSHHAVHGFNPEWIVLDFRDNGKRVDVSSLSMSVPLEIANRLASAYFGGRREYENEV